ncbi:MAG TPA: YdcF family protein [Pseudolabrys sp.]|nr:YdcF family protein [Pseudolabrys sp.]
MFFVLSKTAGFLTLPANLFIVLALVGILLMATRFRRTGLWLTGTGVILLAVAGFSPLGFVLENGLENRFPRWDEARGAPDGIVVLGGVISPVVSRSRGEISLNDAAERITAIAKLAKAYPKARIVFSSGDGSLRANEGAEADYLYPLLDTMGVPRERVTLETRSRNTAENAAFSKELVKPKPGERWLLVTSAFHMPRAIGCFRRAGFPVEAYPVDWHTPRRFRPRPVDDFANGLNHLNVAGHEWAGLLIYWITGRTSALFPAP